MYQDIIKDNINAKFAKLVFALLFFVSLLGYIPNFPYWLYNISTFVTIPILFILLNERSKFTKGEIFFLMIFIFTILLSFFFSPFKFSTPGFLRALVPILFYYLVRVLNIRDNKFFYDIIYYLLILSFLMACYQFFFQPIYVIGANGQWNLVEFETNPMFKRPVSYLGNANVFGIFTVFCFILLFVSNKKEMKPFNKVMVVLLVLLNLILFSKSRTSMLAFFIVVSLYNYHLKNFKAIIFIFVIFVILLVFILLNFEDILVLDQLFRLSDLSNSGDNSYSLRANIAKFSISIIAERPFFGIGPGNEFKLFETINAPHKGMESGSLLLLVERGLVGYLIYLYILFSEFLFSKNNFALVLIGVVMIATDFTETVIVLSQLSTFLAIYLGVNKNESNLKINSI